MGKINIKKIKQQLATRFIGRNIIYFKKIDSTNNYALNIIEEYKKNKSKKDFKKINGSLIISETQTKGRGRLDRNWFSPEGGLWFTILLVSNLDLKDLKNITLISALSVAEALETYPKIRIKIKWPNDLYYKELKIGGILVETESIKNKNFLVCGFGLNVNFTKKVSIPDSIMATSLKDILGKEMNREKILCIILRKLEDYYDIYTLNNNFKIIIKKIEKYMS